MNIFGGNMKKFIVFFASGVLLFYCGMNLEKFITGDFHTLKSEQTVVATTFTQAQEEKTSTQSSNKKKESYRREGFSKGREHSTIYSKFRGYFFERTIHRHERFSD